MVFLGFAQRVYNLLEAEKKTLHRIHLANEGVERVTKLVRDCRINESQERLLCLHLIVQDIFGHVDDLDQMLNALLTFFVQSDDLVNFQSYEFVTVLLMILHFQNQMVKNVVIHLDDIAQ